MTDAQMQGAAACGDKVKTVSTARLFFALWPNQHVRRQLAAQRPTEGKLVAAESLHITLVFLGSVDAERQSAIEQAAADLALPSFQLQLECLQHWRRSGITWLGLATQPSALLLLHEQLKAAALASGIAVETRRYQPHVTLARSSPAVAACSIEPIEWSVTDFCLVESVSDVSGSRYIVRRRWPLLAAVGSAVGGAGSTVE